jgi:signal transduction histidine kinase
MMHTRWLRLPYRPRLPRRTARLRLTVLYGGAVFVACAATLIAFTYGVYELLGRSERPVITLREGGKVIPITGGGSGQATITVVGLGQVVLNRRDLLIDSGITLAVIAVAAVAIGWLIAGRVLRPLRTITAAARRISASSLHERLALRGPDDELKELADTLDGLFARLEASFDAQRRFAANASHELRTPLTRERTLLQVTLADPASTAGTWRAVSRELLACNAEQERLIEAMLALASSEAGTGEREPIDLAAVTSAALAVARPAISQLDLHVETDIKSAALDGDPLLVQQLAANLIANAVNHNIPGGTIQVTTGTSDASAVLSVANSGQVIPADQLDRLFQPFQRLGARTARRDGGHGLGLSIVRAIADAHAATIGARALPDGGLAVDVIFPAPSPPQSPARRPQGGRADRVSASALRPRHEPGDHLAPSADNPRVGGALRSADVADVYGLFLYGHSGREHRSWSANSAAMSGALSTGSGRTGILVAPDGQCR